MVKSQKRPTISWILALVVGAFIATPAAAQTIYVDANAQPGGDGLTWTTAYNYLQDALADAQTGDEIWVAEGTYYPTSDYGLGIGDRGKHFRMINGVAIYGGFPPGGDTFESRDPNQYETILSGDIGTVSDNSDNCYHVFYHPDGLDLGPNAILDGFTITGGQHGICNDNTSAPSIMRCTVTSNQSSGIYSAGSSSSKRSNSYL